MIRTSEPYIVSYTYEMLEFESEGNYLRTRVEPQFDCERFNIFDKPRLAYSSLFAPMINALFE